MKKTIQALALILAMCFALASCGSKPAAPAQSGGDASASASASVETSAPADSADGSASGDASAEASTPGAQVVNPVREVTPEEQVQETNVTLVAPAEATDLTYLVIDSGDPQYPIAELDFNLNGQQYFHRAQTRDDGDMETLAGMYYDWTQTIEDQMVSYCNAVIQAVDGEEKVACILWKDMVPGITYTISVVDTDSEKDLNAITSDLVSIANEIFTPMQGEADGDDVENPVGVYTSYEEVISAVREALAAKSEPEVFEEMGISGIYGYPEDPEAPFGYTYVDLNGDGSDELLMGTGGEFGMLLDGFCMDEGKLVHLFSGGERDVYSLVQDNMVHEQAANSAMNSYDVFYVFDGGMLQVQDEVIYDGEEDEANPWFYVDRSEEKKPITEEEALNILGKYTDQVVEMTPFAE